MRKAWSTNKYQYYATWVYSSDLLVPTSVTCAGHSPVNFTCMFPSCVCVIFHTMLQALTHKTWTTKIPHTTADSRPWGPSCFILDSANTFSVASRCIELRESLSHIESLRHWLHLIHPLQNTLVKRHLDPDTYPRYNIEMGAQKLSS